MITDLIITRAEREITIRTATISDKERYVELELEKALGRALAKAQEILGNDPIEYIWNERYNMDCIMFAIVENKSGTTIGFCGIENISTNEPTLFISLGEQYQGKGYGYFATKAMLLEGWKIFEHDYFIWEVLQNNIASKKLAMKLGGRLINLRNYFSENAIELMKENEEFLKKHKINIDPEDYANSVERYKIERPIDQLSEM